jgi:hypothetical protein
VRELVESPAGKNMSMEADNIVGIHHQAVTGEDVADWEDYVCCSYSDLWNV